MAEGFLQDLIKKSGEGLFVCLLVIVLRPTQEYFTHMETSPYAGEGLQILAYTRHLWPLSSEGSLTCQHLLRHGTSSFTVSSEGQETDQCSQREPNPRPHDPKSSALPTEPPGRPPPQYEFASDGPGSILQDR